MSEYIVDKTKVMTSLSYFCAMKGFRFGDSSMVIKITSTWADEFIDKHKDENFFIDFYYCQAIHTFAKDKIQSHISEIEYKCPRCKNAVILWQKDFVNHIHCPECHYIFDEDKSYHILDRVVQLDNFPILDIRPYGIHIRTKKNPYPLVRKTLSILTGIEEQFFGTVKDPHEDMSTILYRNEYGAYSQSGYSSLPSKSLAQALKDKDSVDYRNGYIIVDYSDDVLYVDLSVQAWEENYPYYTPLIIGNCSK